jgi:hypothetical protein
MLISRRKRYLTGADWVINTLDLVMKKTTCSGNMSQIVLTLDADLDEACLRTALERFLAGFPVLEGTVARDWLLADPRPFTAVRTPAGNPGYLSRHVRDPAARL